MNLLVDRRPRKPKPVKVPRSKPGKREDETNAEWRARIAEERRAELTAPGGAEGKLYGPGAVGRPLYIDGPLHVRWNFSNTATGRGCCEAFISDMVRR